MDECKPLPRLLVLMLLLLLLRVGYDVDDAAHADGADARGAEDALRAVPARDVEPGIHPLRCLPASMRRRLVAARSKVKRGPTRTREGHATMALALCSDSESF